MKATFVEVEGRRFPVLDGPHVLRGGDQFVGKGYSCTVAVGRISVDLYALWDAIALELDRLAFDEAAIDRWESEGGAP